MANTEIFLRNIFGTTRPNIRPLVLALNITNDLLFEQHISMSDIKATKHIYPDVARLLHKKPETVYKSVIRSESTTKLLLRNKPLLVSQAMAFTSPAGLTTFPVCPACMATLEREGQNFCDHCGQRLDWRWYKHAQIIYPGQKSALNILDKDDVLIST